MPSSAVLPASIEQLIAARQTSGWRSSPMISQLSASAAQANSSDRIYTMLLRDRAEFTALRGDDVCANDENRSVRRGPLWGVPVAVKDNIDMRGMPTSCGSRLLARPAALRDAEIVRELERQGAVILGKTNLDEAALGASGRNDHFGRCVNPLGSDRLSGGSSAGSAAAVARGHALLAVGTDTLGSVRIPAALCGIVGFKPTHGAIPARGVVPLYPAFDTVGLMAGSLRDIELAADALRIGVSTRTSIGENTRIRIGANTGPSIGPQAGAVTGARRGTSGGAAAPHLPRVMLLAESALEQVDAGVAADYRRCCDVLRRSGKLSLREFDDLDWVAVANAALWEVSSDFAARIGFQTPGFAGRRGTLGAELGRLLERASSLPPSTLDAGRNLLQDALQRIAAGLAEADALFTPTLSTSAIASQAALPKALTAFVVPANLAGLPAISWPHAPAEGGTTSLQLIGRAGDDRRLIELALFMENLL